MMTRRAMIASLPASTIAVGSTASSPAMARAEDDTPILRLFSQHQAILSAASVHVRAANGKDVDEDLERLFYRRSDEIESELMALPSTCAADFAAKLVVDTCSGDTFSDWETGALWKEARALTGTLK